MKRPRQHTIVQFAWFYFAVAGIILFSGIVGMLTGSINSLPLLIVLLGVALGFIMVGQLMLLLARIETNTRQIAVQLRRLSVRRDKLTPSRTISVQRRGG